jgi:Growth-Arrest-Specific Protein 2 Domain
VIVRVGGGFLSLSEFLDQNVPLELEKMARNGKKLIK